MRKLSLIAAAIVMVQGGVFGSEYLGDVNNRQENPPIGLISHEDARLKSALQAEIAIATANVAQTERKLEEESSKLRLIGNGLDSLKKFPQLQENLQITGVTENVSINPLAATGAFDFTLSQEDFDTLKQLKKPARRNKAEQAKFERDLAKFNLMVFEKLYTHQQELVKDLRLAKNAAKVELAAKREKLGQM